MFYWCNNSYFVDAYKQTKIKHNKLSTVKCIKIKNKSKKVEGMLHKIWIFSYIYALSISSYSCMLVRPLNEESS